MSQQLTSSTDQLFDLVRKNQGIISTHTAGDLEDSAAQVDEKYNTYADTHISLGDTSGFEEQVYDRLLESPDPVKGYLYGPFGYGKTSTAVSIWQTLDQNDVIAVPPFTITTFSSIMRGTYGWLRYEFENRAPGYTDELEGLRDDYLQQEIRSYARRQEADHDVEFDTLVEMFEEMEQRGDLDLSIDADTLIDFFADCTELVLDAGFEGLVVIGDELQQFFKSADNKQEAETRFRDFVFGLHAGASIQDRFGFFVSMPEQTKSTLDTQAGDVLDRLASDNLTLNLTTVYGKDFPTDLWKRYAKKFDFEDQQFDVISEKALDAIGQVCSRQDLSDGPRTVIDLFRIALTQYHNSGECFTALGLAEAFYDGEVRYQGSGTKIQSAIGDALDHSAVDSDSKQQFIKLCSVFPTEGIPDAVVSEYGLGDARRTLSKDLHGDLIKVVAEGYTLIDVTRSEGPQDVIRQLIRDFWGQYDFDHPNAQLASDALTNELICGTIFQVQTGEVQGWAVGTGLQQIDSTTYQEYGINGTFNGHYPNRTAAITVTDDENEYDVIKSDGVLSDGDTEDIAFNFVLGWKHGGQRALDPQIRRESAREFSFVLNGRESFDELPPGIEFLRDAMDPNAVTPFLMLALVQYLNENDTDLDAGEQNRVESFQQSLLDNALKALFDEDLITNAPFEMRRAGRHAVISLFDQVMQNAYPDYDTIIWSSRYHDIMADYVDFLESLGTTSLCRGSDTVKEHKNQVAQRFNLQTTSSFDGRINKHYSSLLEVVNDDANDYEIRATLHPFEKLIVDKLESGERESIPTTDIDALGKEKGYLDDELTIIYTFLSERRIVGMNEHDELILLEKDYSTADVETLIETARNLVSTIEDLDEEKISDGTTAEIMEIDARLDDATDEDGELLEKLHVEAQGIIDDLEHQGEILHSIYEDRCTGLQQELTREARGIVPSHLDDTIEAGVGFVGGLNDARTELLSDFNDVKGDLNTIAGDLGSALSRYSGPTVENAEALDECHQSAEARVGTLEKRTETLEAHAETLKDWNRFTTRVSNVKGAIMDYSNTFDESIDEEDDITDFIGAISERFADDPIDALANLNAFAEKLDRIEEQYESRREERRDVFNEKRERLKEILSEATGGGSTGLRTANFDIRDPQGSQQALLDKFVEAYESQVLDQAAQHLNDAIREVEYARIVGVEAVADPDPDEVAERVTSARGTHEELQSELRAYEFTDINTGTDLDTDGNDLLSTAEELRGDAQQFRRDHAPEDDAVAETLDRIRDQRSVDFKDLLMAYHDDGETIDPEELLDRIEDLFTLNQIDIKVSQLRGR
jgi:hypothetical protein